MPQRKKAYNLLFTIFRARDEINSLHMPHIDFVTEDIGEDNLCNISERERFSNKPHSRQEDALLFLISVQIAIYNAQFPLKDIKPTSIARTFEFLSDIRHLLVYPLLFQFFYPCTTDIRDELRSLLIFHCDHHIICFVPGSVHACLSPSWRLCHGM